MREESEEETMSHKDEEIAADVGKKGWDVGQLWESIKLKQYRSRTEATNGPILQHVNSTSTSICGKNSSALIPSVILHS